MADTPLLKDHLVYSDVCYFITTNCVSSKGTILLRSSYSSQIITNAVFITDLKTLISLLIVDFSDHRGWSFRPGVQITTKLCLLIVQTCSAQEEFYFKIIFVELKWVALLSWFESRKFCVTSGWVMLDDRNTTSCGKMWIWIKNNVPLWSQNVRPKVAVTVTDWKSSPLLTVIALSVSVNSAWLMVFQSLSVFPTS